MPSIGEIRGARELGYKGTARRVWVMCEVCCEGRWVILKRNGEPKYSMCNSCSHKMGETMQRGKTHSHWRGGRMRVRGYEHIHLELNDPFYPMANKKGYVAEHRLVVARYLGRCLEHWEIVHHKNRNKDDIRIENLKLVSIEEHDQITFLENRIQYLEKRVTLLEAENVVLRKDREWIPSWE